jgi:hypothetical protein
MTNSELFKKSVGTRSGVRYETYEVNNFEILFHPADIPKEGLSRFKKVIREASKFIPELKSQPNYWEQLHILYRNINKITNRGIRKSADEIISRLGVATDPPEHIAEVLLKSLREFRKTRCRGK